MWELCRSCELLSVCGTIDHVAVWADRIGQYFHPGSNHIPSRNNLPSRPERRRSPKFNDVPAIELPRRNSIALPEGLKMDVRFGAAYGIGNFHLLRPRNDRQYLQRIPICLLPTSGSVEVLCLWQPYKRP